MGLLGHNQKSRNICTGDWHRSGKRIPTTMVNTFKVCIYERKMVRKLVARRIMCFQRGCSKVRQHLSMVNTDREQAQNNGGAKGPGEVILPCSLSKTAGRWEGRRSRAQVEILAHWNERERKEERVSSGAKKLLWLHEVENIASKLLFSPWSRRLRHMLRGKKQTGRNRGLRRKEKVGNSCYKEMRMRTN